jgi:DNA-binding NtrC family response regulator
MAATQNAALADTSARATTILIVEDEALTRIALSDYLQDRGFKVYEAPSTKDAIAILEKLGDGIDLVFADIQLSGVINGIGLATWLRNKRPDIKVVLTSGYAALKATSGQNALISAPFVEKPYMLPDVEKLLRKTLAS